MTAAFSSLREDELLEFLGMNILISVFSYSRYFGFIGQKLNTSAILIIYRFGFLLLHLYLNDNSKKPKKRQPGFDKLYKIRPMIKKLLERFRIRFVLDPSRRNSFCQWIRHLYREIRQYFWRAIVWVNHCLYFDKFFTRVNVMISLKNENILAYGTVRNNRVCLPKIQKIGRKIVTGEHESRTLYKGISWLKCKDNKIVSLLPNIHNSSIRTIVSQGMKDRSLWSLTCLKVVQDYDKHMSYVDKADMLKSF